MKEVDLVLDAFPGTILLGREEIESLRLRRVERLVAEWNASVPPDDTPPQRATPRDLALIRKWGAA